MATGELGTVAKRYAGALYDLARERGEATQVEQALDQLSNFMKESQDFQRLVLNPIFSNVDQERGLNAIFAKSEVEGTARDFLLLLAKNRRLFALEKIITEYKTLMSQERGEIEARVVSAVPMTSAQQETLIDTLRQKLGKTPKLTLVVDPTLLGGLVVKVGSQMIDTSLKTKLRNLEIAMKEAH